MLNFIHHQPIGRKLNLGFMLTLLFSILITVVAINRLHAVAAATEELLQEPLATERLLSDWYRNIHSGIRRTQAIAKSADPALSTFFAEDQEASSKSSASLQKAIEAHLDTEHEKTLFNAVMDARKVYVGLREKIIRLKKDNKFDEANQVLDQEFIPASKVYVGQIEAMLKEQREQIDATAKSIQAIYESSRNLMLLTGFLGFLFCFACANFLARVIVNPVSEAASVARQVAAGDLNVKIRSTRNDEIGQLLRDLHHMAQQLSALVAGVRSSTETITIAAQEIAAGNADLSSRTEAQAGSLEETASSMEELTATVKQNAENAQQANQLVVSASGVAVKGGQVVGQVVTTMGSIKDSSRKIVDIIAVIDGIAFQTNILALNAAVEAARAGEQGRGFAVVASEVRNLAQRSANAAKEIKHLINDSVEKVEQGGKLVDDAGQTMSEIVSSVQRVADIMSEISAASQEQSSGIGQINLAIAHMDEMTQQNAALVEQAAAAAESMEEQAHNLARAVSVFKLNPLMPHLV